MNILIVYAHPEPRSLNGSLKDVAVNFLRSSGHEVIVSDLYTMNWKTAADRNDFTHHDSDQRLFYMQASAQAYYHGMQTDGIKKEQEKLLWADVVIFQFPFWWFGMPAILKGWIDRVFACGFAYGVGQYDEKNYGSRYGEGTFEGKKGMLSITIGGRKDQYGPRGINGPVEDLLFPIHHGMLWYAGMSVLPPFLIYQANTTSDEQFEQHKLQYQERLSNLKTAEPIPFRYQNNGHYNHRQQLKKKFVNGESGFTLHIEK